VFVLRGAAHAMDSNTIDAVRRAAFGVQQGRQLRGIIVLMDPDDAGRRGAFIHKPVFSDRVHHEWAEPSFWHL
jgi:5S rRNA maturation endonuclease (ribonuclease M5)